MYKIIALLILFGFFICGAAIATDHFTSSDRQELLRSIDAQATHYGDVSRKIWEFAEVGYKEIKVLKFRKESQKFQRHLWQVGDLANR